MPGSLRNSLPQRLQHQHADPCAFRKILLVARHSDVRDFPVPSFKMFFGKNCAHPFHHASNRVLAEDATIDQRQRYVELVG